MNVQKEIRSAFAILLLAVPAFSVFIAPAFSFETQIGKPVDDALALVDKYKHRDAIALLNKAIPTYTLPCADDFHSVVNYLTKIKVDSKCDEIIKHGGLKRMSFSIRGIAYASLGDFNAALKEFNSALAMCPRSASIICNKGRVLLRQGKLNEALLETQKALKIEPNLAAGHKLLGFIYKSQRLYKKSSEEYSYYRALAEREIVGDEYFYATSVLDAAIAQSPKNAHLYRARGRARLLENKEGATADYKKAIQLEPSYALAYSGLGKLYMRGREFKLAKAAVDKAVKLDSNIAKVWIDKGCVYSYLDQYQTTLQSFDRAVKIEPANLHFRQLRADARFATRDIAGAMSDCDFILKREPDNALALITRADCLRRMGKFHAAIALATRAIELKPKNADAYYCRSECYFRLGQMELAQADEDLYKKLRPETQAHQDSQMEAESIADELESATVKDRGVAKPALPAGGRSK